MSLPPFLSCDSLRIDLPHNQLVEIVIQKTKMEMISKVKKTIVSMAARIFAVALSVCMMVGGITAFATEAADELDVFGEIADVEFCFSSGAGAWGTSLRINADGTFTGDYHDTDMGDTGESYPFGTMYSYEFSGKFKNLQKVDDFTYSFELDYLREDAPKKEFIDDHGVRIVPAEAYGLEIGKTYMLYLPGAEMNTLPEKFVHWVAMPMGWSSDEIPLSLPFYGIYNLDGQYGFFGSKNDNPETLDARNEVYLPLAFAGIALLACGAVLFKKMRVHNT